MPSLAGRISLCYFEFVKNSRLITQLSEYLFWDVDSAGIDPEAHRQFIISRVMERGTLADVKAVWDYYGEEKIKQTLLNAATLGRKTVAFFANQFDLPRDAFRAYRNPPKNWP
jgi:hypothetical protein